MRSEPERRSAAGRRALTRDKLLLWLGVLFVLELVVALLGLTYGSSTLGPGRLLEALFGGEALSPSERSILWLARAPRVCFAAIVGGALSCAGVMFQALLRNPLADPYVLGISGGGALFATLWLVLGGGMWLGGAGVPVAAMVGSLGALLALLFAARWPAGGGGVGRMSVYVMMLLGVVFNAFASAVITLLKAIVSAQKAQELLFYLMGTLSVEGMSWGVIGGSGAVVALCVLGMWRRARALNVMGLGEEVAQTLGVEVWRVRVEGVVLASVAVSVAVAYTGLIGFIGLVVPHGLRLLLGPDHRVLIPASVLGGAIFLTGSDLLARVSFEVFSMTLPVGVVTALIGAPLFVMQLRHALRSGSMSDG